MRWNQITVLVLIGIVTAGIGYAVGISTPTPIAPDPNPTPEAMTQSAPEILSPMPSSEFVDSDITLTWDWTTGLSESQRYVVRVWTGDLPVQEIWTTDPFLNAKDVVDSFSVELGTFYWQVAVVNTNTDGNFDSMASDWADSDLQRVRRLSIASKPYDEMSAWGQYFHDLDLSPTDTIDAVHRFIQTNSILDQQKSYNADYSDAIELMYNFSQGISTEQPVLQCDGRSASMLTTLRELGIESRMVFLYRPVPGYLSQHTTLEVFNPETQAWQVHDLNWDFYYVDGDTGQRAAAERILFGDRDTLVGCPMEGGDCTFEVIEESMSYFNALRYGYTFEFFVNPDRFDLSERFVGQGNRNLAEFVGDDVSERITFVLDNWMVEFEE